MDNLAHTLAGAALGEAGLKKLSGLGMATLMIAANLPDIDVIGLFVGENLAWRRGWTHGPIALVVLPILLAAIMVWFDRWQARTGRRPEARLPVRFSGLLVLAYIGILSHPLLDFLNTYGIRCLMPFSDRWFYGDALFIIDLWMWLTLGLGVWLARRRQKKAQARPHMPAIAALVLMTIYTGAMSAAGIAAERIVVRALKYNGDDAPETVIAMPVPIDPFRRSIVYSLGDEYGFGELRWTPAPQLQLNPVRVPTNMHDPAVAEAAKQKIAADFLYWSRLPFADIQRRPDGTHVTIGDARYGQTPTDNRFNVQVTLPATAAAP